MDVDIYTLTLADRDNYLEQIEQQIETKRKLLLLKRKRLQKSVKNNIFLEGVKNDYQKYHDYIVGQKKDQIKSMELLKNYIDDLMISGELTDKDINNNKKDQQEILQEMDKIKKDLDNIINS